MSREQRTRCQKQRCVGFAHNGLRLAVVPEMSKPRGVAERRSRLQPWFEASIGLIERGDDRAQRFYNLVDFVRCRMVEN